MAVVRELINEEQNQMRDCTPEMIESRRPMFNAIMNNFQMITKREDGTPALCSVTIPLELLHVDMRYQGNRKHKKISKLVNNWSMIKLMPIIVVPHIEECLFYVVDGQGRVTVANLKGMEDLPALMIMYAPKNPVERLIFEAKYFSSQGAEDEKLRKVEKHPAMVLSDDPAACAIENMLHKYNLTFEEDKGQRKSGVIGSYTEAYRTASVYGENCLDYIFSIIDNAGWKTEKNGCSQGIMRALCNVYAAHKDNRAETNAFLSKELRQLDPELYYANARTTYPKRDQRSAYTLYMEDLVCNGLGLERRVYVENSKMIIMK